MSVQLSAHFARRLAIQSQLLNHSLPRSKQGALQAIEHLGYVQIDTIAVIERAHHHTLWTRQPNYRPSMLHELQAADRGVFEYWGHAASYLPMSDYRYYLPKMQSYHNPQGKWEQQLLAKSGHLLEPVLKRVREEGPLTAQDFEPAAGKKRAGWWDWKPAKAALELLFWRGDLMIAERRNFQRVYDLRERVLPQGVDTSMPDEGELGAFLVRRALRSLGVATPPELQDHIRTTSRRVISRALDRLVESGEVVPVSIPGGSKEQDYALPEYLQISPRISKRVSLLSPFDNLIANRDRVSRLFGFDYMLECYVPAAKRIYGYFVLAILWGTEFVGRLDPKADRQREVLVIHNLQFEPDFEQFDRLLPKLADRLLAFSRFNGCRQIELKRVSPQRIKRPLAELFQELS